MAKALLDADKGRYEDITTRPFTTLPPNSFLTRLAFQHLSLFTKPDRDSKMVLDILIN